MPLDIKLFLRDTKLFLSIIRRDQIAKRQPAIYGTVGIAVFASVGWARALAGAHKEPADLIRFVATSTALSLLIFFVIASLVGLVVLFRSSIRTLNSLAENSFNGFVWTLFALGGGGFVFGLIMFDGEFLWIAAMLKGVEAILNLIGIFK